MGLDVYQRFILGVKIKDHAKFKYDSRYNCTRVELWDGKKANYRDIPELLDESGIDWTLPTEYYDQVVIGLAVNVDDGYVNEVPSVNQEMIHKAKAMLSDIGIDAEPKLYAVVRLSY